MSSQAEAGPNGLSDGDTAPTLNRESPANRPTINGSPRQPNTPSAAPIKNGERVNEPTTNGGRGINGVVGHQELAVNGNNQGFGINGHSQELVVNGDSQPPTTSGEEQDLTINEDYREQEGAVNGNHQTPIVSHQAQAPANGGHDEPRTNSTSPEPVIDGGHGQPALNGGQGGAIYTGLHRETAVNGSHAESRVTTISPEPAVNGHAQLHVNDDLGEPSVNGNSPEPVMNGNWHLDGYSEPMPNGFRQETVINGRHESLGDSGNNSESPINGNGQHGLNGIAGDHADPMDLGTAPPPMNNGASQQGQQQLNGHNGGGCASPQINSNDGPSSSPPSNDGHNNTHTAFRSGPQSASDPQTDSPRRTATTELRALFVAEKKKLTEKKDKIKGKNPPGGYDPTPLPDAPQGYTLKFTFHKAYNLPIADLKTNAADPFLHATLTTAVPKRHKEDPPLTRRTPTIRKSTEPVWEDEWIVANIPSTGFTLKCRLYDEDWSDHDDRLGNVTIKVPQVDENWEGFDGQVFEVKKRSGSKRAYFFKAVSKLFCHADSMTPRLHISIQVIGKSDPPHAQMYTVGPATWVKHFSPMIGRLTGTKVNRNEDDDAGSVAEGSANRQTNDRQTKKYEFVPALPFQVAQSTEHT